MKFFGGLVEQLAAVPAFASTAPSWNSELAVTVLALITVAAYVRMAFEIDAEVRGA